MRKWRICPCNQGPEKRHGALTQILHPGGGRTCVSGPDSLTQPQNRRAWGEGEGKALLRVCILFLLSSSTPSLSEPGGSFGILYFLETLPLTISTIAPSSDLNGDTFGRAPDTSRGPAPRSELNPLCRSSFLWRRAPVLPTLKLRWLQLPVGPSGAGS